MTSKSLMVLRTTWCVVVAALIVLLLSGPSELRLSVLILLSWLSFPASFITVPIVNRVVGMLDVESTRSIDSIVSASIALVGYAQWFWLVPRLRRMVRCGDDDGLRVRYKRWRPHRDSNPGFSLERAAS